VDQTLNISTLFETYRKLRQQKEETERAAKEAKQAFDDISRQLATEMVEQGCQAWKSADGIGLHLRQQFAINVTKANEAQIKAWLREQVGDDKPFVEEKLIKAAVTAVLKEKIESGDLEEAPPFFGLYMGKDLVVNDWKGGASNGR
jgi:hypothetical protein